MNKKFPLKAKFKNWLVENFKISEESAKSYLSYVTGADKLISVSRKEGEKDNLFSIIETGFLRQDINLIEETILLVIEELSRKDADIILGRPKKTLHNYRSGLHSYLKFLSEQPFPVDNTKEGEIDETTQSLVEDIEVFTISGKSLTKDSAIKVYSRFDLEKTFSFRISTQDRFYNDIFFPIRFITRVFNKRKERSIYSNWMNQLLNSITVYVEEHKIPFAEITALTIENNKVYVTHMGIEKQAYTKLSDNKTLVPFNVLALKKIAIDHDRSLYDVMKANVGRLPTIVQITNELKKYIKGNVSYPKLSKASHSSILDEFIETIDTRKLLLELELIASETSLQLMDSSQNTSKGKR